MLNTSRNFVLASGLACVLALGACSVSGSTEQTVSTEISTTDEEGNTTTTTTTETTTDDGTGPVTETTSETTTSTADESDDAVYTNEGFGIQFTAPAGWQLQDSSANLTTNSNLAALAGDAKLVMVGTPTDGSASAVLFAMEEPSEANANLTAEDRVKSNAEEDKKAIEETGLQIEINDATINIGDEALPADEYVMTTSDGTQTYVLQGVKKTEDGYFLDIIILGNDETEVLGLVGNIAAYQA